MKSDLDLLADFKRGDRTAFDKLIRRHHVELINFFYPLSGNAALSEELTQTVFLRIHADLTEHADLSLWTRHRGEMPHAASRFPTYLLRTGILCWAEHVRSTGRPARALPASHDQEFSAPTAQHKSDDAYVLLASLPDDLKPVVILADVNGLTYSEISVVLNIPENMVRHRMKEAYAQLQIAFRASIQACSIKAEASVSSTDFAPPPAPPSGPTV